MSGLSKFSVEQLRSGKRITEGWRTIKSLWNLTD